MSPRPPRALLPRDAYGPHPREGAAVYYAVGLTSFDPECRRFAGADTPIPDHAQRRDRVRALLNRAAALVAKPLRRT